MMLLLIIDKDWWKKGEIVIESAEYDELQAVY